MIELRNVCKSFVLNGNRKVVANNLNLVVPDGTAIGVLGRNGAGKSTLLKLLAGTMDPDSGEVVRTGSVSWPVGFAGSFHQELTGLQNTRFIARVYGVDSDELTNFVHHFSELGQHFYLPVRSYSSGMRSRLAFGISMGIPFDTYLVDEVTAVGDGSFKRKSEAVFAERLRSSAAVMVTHALGQVIRLCDHAAVLEQGTLHFYEDPREGVHHHQRLMQAAHPNA